MASMKASSLSPVLSEALVSEELAYLIGWLADSEITENPNLLCRDNAPFVASQHISSHCELFASRHPANCYYLLLSGDLIAYRPRMHFIAGRAKIAVRFFSQNELFYLACDSKRVADCVAISNCTVLRIDCSRLDRQASRHSLLRGILNRIHASELQWLLAPLDMDVGKFEEEQPDLSDAGFVADLP